MKILYVINSLGSGGAEKLIADSLPHLKNQGLDIELLLLTSKNSVFYDDLVKENVKIKISRINKIYSFKNIFEIKNLLKNNNYDIVHFHLFPTLYWVTLSKFFNKKIKTKFIYTEHSNNNRRRKILFFKYFDKLIYSKIDVIISITKSVEKNLQKWLEHSKGKNERKFEVVENGVDLSKIYNALPANKYELIDSYKEGIKFLTMVSRFSDAKDHETVVKAMVNLPDSIHLLLVGRGEKQDQIIELVQLLNISNRVHFLGFRKDVANILKASDFIVLSSHWEGLSLSSIEGMASGRPFIGSNVEGIAEIVDDYGLLFERGNILELSSLISRLDSDDEYYEEVALQCKKRSKYYDIKNMVNKLVKIYESTLNIK